MYYLGSVLLPDGSVHWLSSRHTAIGSGVGTRMAAGSGLVGDGEAEDGGEVAGVDQEEALEGVDGGGVGVELDACFVGEAA